MTAAPISVNCPESIPRTPSKPGSIGPTLEVLHLNRGVIGVHAGSGEARSVRDFMVSRWGLGWEYPRRLSRECPERTPSGRPEMPRLTGPVAQRMVGAVNTLAARLDSPWGIGNFDGRWGLYRRRP